MDKQQAKEQFNYALEHEKPEFEHFFLAKFLGLNFLYENEQCIITFSSKRFMFNPQGTLHGGVITFVLDVSMGHLCKKHLGTAITVEMKTQFLRPVSEGDVQCVSTFVKKGSKLAFLKSNLYNEQGKLAATATSTWLKTE
ncbi:PaaI family thioesterase [Alteribacillus iranensis]|uniref:Uncharacterized domain 1-containing protein n=1 Tax=Alteribacillus iranensis TaxID=930128 RepID=A0A1I2BBQ6_9BACI|nr:PaaI family thioesterase [Alteribacillus iranensis]SFE53652.1 uncharacterized domain 1-containing protein [Alteribacillus iranensis]